MTCILEDMLNRVEQSNFFVGILGPGREMPAGLRTDRNLGGNPLKLSIFISRPFAKGRKHPKFQIRRTLKLMK